MDLDSVSVHKLAKKERGQYQAILTEQAWSIKDSLYGLSIISLRDTAGNPEHRRTGRGGGGGGAASPPVTEIFENFRAKR